MVNPINDAPTSMGLPNLSNVDSESIIVNVASNFSDVDADTLTFSATGLSMDAAASGIDWRGAARPILATNTQDEPAIARRLFAGCAHTLVSTASTRKRSPYSASRQAGTS